MLILREMAMTSAGQKRGSSSLSARRHNIISITPLADWHRHAAAASLPKVGCSRLNASPAHDMLLYSENIFHTLARNSTVDIGDKISHFNIM